MRCPKCNMENPDSATQCTKCGQELTSTAPPTHDVKPQPTVMPKNNKFAIGSLVCGISGLLIEILGGLILIIREYIYIGESIDQIILNVTAWFMVLGFVLSIIGILFGSKAKKSEQVIMAKVGFWLSLSTISAIIIGGLIMGFIEFTAW